MRSDMAFSFAAESLSRSAGFDGSYDLTRGNVQYVNSVSKVTVSQS